MDYSHIHLEDLIDTSRVQDLVPTYPHFEPISPSPTQDNILLIEQVEVVPTIGVIAPQVMYGNPGSSFLYRHEVTKKRKIREEYTQCMEAMDMDKPVSMNLRYLRVKL